MKLSVSMVVAMLRKGLYKILVSHGDLRQLLIEGGRLDDDRAVISFIEEWYGGREVVEWTIIIERRERKEEAKV